MPIHLPRPNDAKRQRSQIRQLANLLDDHTIDTLIERARLPKQDHWPPGGGGTAGNDISRPTEAAATKAAGGRITKDDAGNEICTPDTWPDTDDTVRTAIAELFAQLAEATGLLRIIDQRRQWLANIHDSARQRTNPTELCAGCNQPITTDEGLPGRVKRLDGQPYHHPDPTDGQPQPQCWWHAYRARTTATMQPDDQKAADHT